MKHNNTLRYTLFGTFFGIAFPIIATLVDTMLLGLPLTIDSVIAVQTQKPLHWIIDTAPIFLGIFAGIAGRRQDQLTTLFEQLQTEVTFRNQAYHEIEILRDNLEQEVIERTAKLETQTLQFKAVAEVGHAATTIRDIDDLLAKVTHFISDRFNFYHVGIFLLNESGELAVLRAANSEGGQRMLARNHTLSVAETSIVGHVTKFQKPHIVLDVGQDAVFFNNPDLPDTHSEMALPLIVGNKLLGALDVQSKRVSAFTDDDIAVLQLLADQVAIAIENAQLFSENRQALEATSRAYSKYSSESWNLFFQSNLDVGFISSTGHAIKTVTSEWSPAMLDAKNNGDIVYDGLHTIAIPIKSRNQVLGVIRVTREGKTTPWNKREVALLETLTNQLEIALDTARLYEETQQSAQQEKLIGEATTRMRETLDLETVLKTAAQELRQALELAEVEVHLGSYPAAE